MQLKQYQKDLLLKLLNEHDDLLLQQLRLCNDNKSYEEHRKKSLEVTELIEMIEKVPTVEDMINHLTRLADMYKDSSFEERVKLYQEENAKACKVDIPNYKGRTDIIMPTLYTMPVLNLNLNNVKMEGEVDVYKATIKHTDK